MEEVGSPLKDQVFRASDFAGVEEQQLRPVTDLEKLITETQNEIKIKGLFTDDYEEEFEYQIKLDYFNVLLLSGSTTLLNVNPNGNGIKWENSRFFYG